MATKTIPDPEKARDALRAAQEEEAFWEKHYPELLARYPDQFVAVRGGKVIASDSDLMRLATTLEKRGIKPTDVWMQFIDTKPDRFLL
jgi:Family of unknown function (DUF5678)